MVKRNIAERHHNLLKQKELLLQKEKMIKESLRKERTKTLIEKGVLMEKAGLLSLDVNTIYGILLEASDHLQNTQKVHTWTKRGGEQFLKENKAKNLSPIILQFKTEPDSQIRSYIRSLGLRWNAIRKEWQGFAPLDVINNIAKAHDATLIASAPLQEDTKESS